ncbi:MAG: DUF6452 family protein [Marinilabiliales bacterium]|nr:DUF6452 family protein [Marinilabiliales bacterium]
MFRIPTIASPVRKRSTCVFFTLAALCSESLGSCSVQPCYEDIDPVMNTILLTSGTGESAKADSLRVRGISPTDTIEFVNVRSVSSFSVPLDPSSDQSLFFITLNGIADTAVIFYTRYPHLVSPECGYTFVSRITGLMTTHNIIDTLMIENNNVNLNGEKNLHLFY